MSCSPALVLESPGDTAGQGETFCLEDSDTGAGLMTRRAAIIVLDGLGIGPASDTGAYGDAGSDTLGNVARAVGGFSLPQLEALGLGNCAPLPGITPAAAPRAANGVCEPASPGKDSITGHWEICGVILPQAFPTYPHGFPSSLIELFAGRTGRGVLGNKAASGTEILEEYGAEHCRTGDWIVYTSADSVFQIAAHESKVALEELYAACAVARALLVEEHGV
jgi:phosphopentomutase